MILGCEAEVTYKATSTAARCSATEANRSRLGGWQGQTSDGRYILGEIKDTSFYSFLLVYTLENGIALALAVVIVVVVVGVVVVVVVVNSCCCRCRCRRPSSSSSSSSLFYVPSVYRSCGLELLRAVLGSICILWLKDTFKNSRCFVEQGLISFSAQCLCPATYSVQVQAFNILCS